MSPTRNNKPTLQSILNQLEEHVLPNLRVTAKALMDKRDCIDEVTVLYGCISQLEKFNQNIFTIQ